MDSNTEFLEIKVTSFTDAWVQKWLLDYVRRVLAEDACEMPSNDRLISLRVLLNEILLPIEDEFAVGMYTESSGTGCSC